MKGEENSKEKQWDYLKELLCSQIKTTFEIGLLMLNLSTPDVRKQICDELNEEQAEFRFELRNGKAMRVQPHK